LPTTFALKKQTRGLSDPVGTVKTISGSVQVAPIEIISICDPDKQMLAEAVEIASQKTKSPKKQPAQYKITRRCLRRTSTSCLVGSPDHCTLCTPSRAGIGADVYCRSRSADVR